VRIRAGDTSGSPATERARFTVSTTTVAKLLRQAGLRPAGERAGLP
jgi:hypothetical protein